MRTADFDFELPPELIAQIPVAVRDQARLLVLDRPTGRVAHRWFRDALDCLRAGDAVVLNDSRVIPARLRARNARTGGRLEVLLVEEVRPDRWWALLRPARRASQGVRLQLLGPDGTEAGITATVLAASAEGRRELAFSPAGKLARDLERLGEVPLPPYIRRAAGQSSELDRARYQTVYAALPGSVAAPTAGLHFTAALLDEIRARGVKVCFVTLHVGPGTFAPVKSEEVSGHVMHEERFTLGPETVATLAETRRAGGRVFAVGTTTLRVLESVAEAHDGQLVPMHGRTRLFVHPPRRFRVVDALLTNFHLPRSTLLMLVCAFAAPGQTRGRELVLRAYAEAIRAGYRFFSYGDAMLIL